MQKPSRTSTPDPGPGHSSYSELARLVQEALPGNAQSDSWILSPGPHGVPSHGDQQAHADVRAKVPAKVLRGMEHGSPGRHQRHPREYAR